MRERIARVLILCFVVGVISLLSSQVYKHSIPKQGKILRYENFRGYAVPIKADGVGGSYRWMKDVPWNVFTIEEKFDWAKVRGGHLNENDIQEIRQKYGVK